MTKLEEEISHKITACEFATKVNGEFCFLPENVAKAAAEVAKKYIEKAYIDGADAVIHEINTCGQKTFEYSRTLWLKENGIVE